MQKEELDIHALGYNKQRGGYYTLILVTKESPRVTLSVKIASPEAQAISIEMENLVPNRPLTHDLFKILAEEFNIVVEEIIIYDIVDDVFYSKIICFDGLKRIEIDARTSDAIALSVRFKCPIYTYRYILQSAGEYDEIELESVYQNQQKFELKSRAELEKELAEALQKEEYEQAAKIRDELQSRY